MNRLIPAAASLSRTDAPQETTAGPRAFPAVDFARHCRRIQRMLGNANMVGVCNAAGILVWARNDDDQTRITAALGQLERGKFDWRSTGKQHRPQVVSKTESLLAVCFGDESSPARGWLVLIGDRAALLPDSPLLSATTAAMENTVESIRDECELHVEMNQLATELAERRDELRLVEAIDGQIARVTGGWDTLRTLTGQCANELGADVAVLVHPEDGSPLTVANHGIAGAGLDALLIETRGDLYRFVQASRETVMVNAANDNRRRYLFTDLGYKVLACALPTDGGAIAMLAFMRHEDRPDFAATDRRRAEIMAGRFSRMLPACRSMQELKGFGEQAASALLEVVGAKDPQTRRHCERVCDIAIDLGHELGLAPDDLDDLRWSALLHDVGKVGVPDSLLCRPGPVTRDDYVFIRLHPERGCDIVRHIPRLHRVIPGIRHHHERINGQGYPRGLAGDGIPVIARIIAVADAYDAIVNPAAYRQGRSHDEALVEIRRAAGTQFDSAFVEALITVCNQSPRWLPADTGPRTATVISIDRTDLTKPLAESA